MLKKIILILLSIILLSGTAMYLKANDEPLNTRVLIERLDELTLTLSKEDGKGIKSMSLRVGDTGKLLLIGKNISGKKIPVKIDSRDFENIYFHQFNPNTQSADEFTYQAREAGVYDYTFSITDGENTLKKTVQFIIRPGLNLYGSSRPNCEFSDTDSALVRKFCQAGIINGYSDGTFRPEATINRAEMMKIAYQLFGNAKEINETAASLISNNIFPFADVEPNHWAAPFIAIAKKLGKIQGYEDGTFIPFQEVKRGEAWKMMTEAGTGMDPILQASFDLEKENITNDAWFTPYSQFGKKIGMNLPGENQLADWELMAEPITRLEVIDFMNKLIDVIPTETVVYESEKKN
jgi:hypothetical protein